jgi:hypothetical protein
LEAARQGLLQPRSQQCRDRLRDALTQQVHAPQTERDFQTVATTAGAQEIAERTLAIMLAKRQRSSPEP